MVGAWKSLEYLFRLWQIDWALFQNRPKAISWSEVKKIRGETDPLNGDGPCTRNRFDFAEMLSTEFLQIQKSFLDVT